MSALAAAKAKGIKLGAEPRKLAILGVLVALAIVVVIYNSGSDTPGPSATTTTAVKPSATAIPPTASTAARLRARRRLAQQRDRNGALRMQEVTLEAQQGQIDPTLRLDMLDRLKNVNFSGGTRSLFEAGPAVATAAQLAAKSVKIMPGQLPPNAVHPVNAQINPQFAPIPLKFYGFSAPVSASGPRRGFFLDEDNILIADEGETVKGHYRIVSLQPKSAEVEDTVTKNKQTLPIVPEGQQNAF
jgi:hypothetical protein